MDMPLRMPRVSRVDSGDKTEKSTTEHKNIKTNNLNGSELKYEEEYAKGLTIALLRNANTDRSVESINKENTRLREIWRREVYTQERIVRESKLTDSVLLEIEKDTHLKEVLYTVFDKEIIRREVIDRVRLGLSSDSITKRNELSNTVSNPIKRQPSAYEIAKKEEIVINYVVGDLSQYAEGLIRRAKIYS